MINNNLSLKTRKRILAYLFLTPGMLILIIFTFYPVLCSIPLSFFNYSIGDGTFTYIGLKNYARALHDKDFLISIINSLTYVLIVPIIQIVSLLLAMLVNKKIKGINIFRSIYFIPVVTSLVAVSIAWSGLLDEQGLINHCLMKLGLISKNIPWLTSTKTALGSLMFVTFWHGIGYYMMLYLAGLQSISNDLIEAATVDGANKSTITWKIIIPLMKPYVLFCTLISVMGAIRVFDEAFILTKGGPGTSTLVSSLYIYQQSFVTFDFGYASAVGMLVSIIITFLSILTFKFNKQGGMNYY